jgi:transcriptional regulator with XRE-family HTH domain
MARIGAEVRQWRQAYGMSQAELARRAKISLQAMNDLEQGRTKDPRFSVMQRIARVLGVSLDLFSATED